VPFFDLAVYVIFVGPVELGDESEPEPARECGESASVPSATTVETGNTA
jgi:hypothetical protein